MNAPDQDQERPEMNESNRGETTRETPSASPSESVLVSRTEQRALERERELQTAAPPMNHPMAETHGPHTMGGITTRDDATDLGVPMIPGNPTERQGPEDALGVGPKRGDYRERLGGSSYNPHQIVPIPPEMAREMAREAGTPESRQVMPTAYAEAQKPRAEQIGNAGGKGGTQGSEPDRFTELENE